MVTATNTPQDKLQTQDTYLELSQTLDIMSKPLNTMSDGLKTASGALTAMTTALMTGDNRFLEQLEAEKIHIRYTQPAPNDPNLLSLEKGLSSFWSSAHHLSADVSQTLADIEQYYIRRGTPDGPGTSPDSIAYLVRQIGYERRILKEIKGVCERTQDPNELEYIYRNFVFALRDRLRFWEAACKTHQELRGVIGEWGPEMQEEADRQANRLLGEWADQCRLLPPWTEKHPHNELEHENRA